MSELIECTGDRAAIHWKLLTGVSALALMSYFSSTELAHAEGVGRPVVWLEVDTQFVGQSVGRESYFPLFLYNSPFDSAFEAESKKPPSDWDNSARISLQPSGSDWIMSIGIRYGKSHRQRAEYQQTRHAGRYPSFGYFYTAYQDGKSSSSEKHLILDFQAGKDVGLGHIGSHGTSVFSLGVRYAQFDSRSNFSVKSVTTLVPSSYYIFHGAFDAARSFNGVGPSLSWDASANLVGSQHDGSLTFDWGVKGALLFGRQRVVGHHEKTALYQKSWYYYGPPKTTVYQTAHPLSRSHSVTVPALSVYAALSLRYTNAKVTLGYRYDNYFGVIDGGIDARKSFDRGFYGPFASFSIGLGG